ncbi:DNA translocase FtsK [Candidatus Falkowbacteria bacterium]|nr:DNA translocase FtsK [Candidatus Falkowbacteria bacterium]NCT54734.1 DNA translocase FtsK [Candidatus Falkowbacteria bacterium]
MSRKRKKQSSFETVSMPSLELSDKARKSIFIVFLAVFGLISLLGLFNLSGHFGGFVAKYLGLIFGFGKWLVPLIFLYSSLVIAEKVGHYLQFSNYFGLFLLFISYQGLFHFFIPQEVWEASALAGRGGGYIGLYLSQATNYVFGFFSGVIILVALFLIAIILTFNTSLTKIIGRESYLAKIFLPLFLFFQALFSGKTKIESENDDEYEDEDEENGANKAQEFIDSAREEVLSSWAKKEIDYLAINGGESSEEELNPAALHQGTLKVQEKIVWPKKRIKIDLPIELLNNKFSKAVGGDIEANAEKIKKTLEKFGIGVEMGETKVGPTVTQYTFRPAEGVKLSRITTLNNDLSLSLAAHPIRIEAPIPGKSLVGVEVPNKAKAIVGLREILDDDNFKKRKNNLMISLGKDVAGTVWLYDLTKMPHLLVAGATNSGKSVCLNAIIISLLYQNNPDDVRFIMVDPKRVELPTYNGIPHLLTPVITDVNKTINALKWCLNEMDRRYDLLNKSGKRNIQSYNAVTKEKLPYIIFIIDELADFMMTSGKEMEAAIIRLAQMSRAIGIHLILATQRPSVDVITGLIKANIPTRIAFSVASLVDSKTILDSSGAEKLLGQGDMLFSAAEFSKPKRIQGAYLSDEEINDVVNYIKEKSGEAEYLEGVTDRQKVNGNAGIGLDGTHGDEDELFEEAKEIIVKAGKASTSMLQRRLSIGYGRAAKILDMLEEGGIISASNGSKPRDVLIDSGDYNSDRNSLSGIPIHNRDNFRAPESYFSSSHDHDDEELDGSDDGILVFNNKKAVETENKDDEAEENLEDPEDEIEEKNAAELLLDEEEVEEVIDDEDEILEDIRNKDEKKQEPTNSSTEKTLPFEEDDEMFFSR